MSAGASGGARAHFSRFLGVSLGGGRGKSTAVCRLERDADGVVVTQARHRLEHRGGGPAQQGIGPFRDANLLAWIKDNTDEHTVLAIDVPLTLPPCIRCTLGCPGIDACTVSATAWLRDVGAPLLTNARRGGAAPKPAITPYTQRPAEILLSRAGLSPRETLGQGMGPLSARGAYLSRALAPRFVLHENLLEVHPRATLIRRFGAVAERVTRVGDAESTWSQRRALLLALLSGGRLDKVWLELIVRSQHVFEAVVAAFTAMAWAREGWRGPIDLCAPIGRSATDDPQRGGPDTGAGSERRSLAAPDEALARAVRVWGEGWRADGWIWVPPPVAPASAGPGDPVRRDAADPP